MLGREKKTYNVEPMFISRKITDKEIEDLVCTALKKSS
jgi:hypothetical protein